MIQITIKEEDNLKVAAWLMQNGIEHSSNPIEWNAKTLQAMKEAYKYYMSLMEEQTHTPTEPKEGKEAVKDSLTTESDAPIK